jgi:hypothetical protein
MSGRAESRIPRCRYISMADRLIPNTCASSLTVNRAASISKSSCRLVDSSPGSVIVVTRLDRLGRSTIDLLTIVKQIADRGCLFKSLRF